MNLLPWFYIVPLRLRSVFRRRQVEAELNDELHHHLECKIEDGIARAFSAEEARRVALLELGGIEQRKEDCRDVRGLRWLEDFLQDLRYGFRWLRKSPGFSVIVMLALALGLGANTGLFSLFNRILLQTLPVVHPEQLVILTVANERLDSIRSFSYPMYRGLRDQNSVFSGILAQAGADMAHYFFGKQNPLGKKFGTESDAPPDIEIVGVVQDAKYVNLREKSQRHFYTPLAQEPRLYDTTLHLRTSDDSRAIVGSLRQILQQIDPNLPLYDITTLESELNESIARDRLITWLSTSFGALATLLAGIGLYGVIAFSVVQRTREIGIRMALGAQRFDVLRLVLKQTALHVLIGIATGLLFSLGATRILQSLLFDVRLRDPVAYLGAALVLVMAAILATYSPARRATQVNPTVALRYE